MSSAKPFVKTVCFIFVIICAFSLQACSSTEDLSTEKIMSDILNAPVFSVLQTESNNAEIIKQKIVEETENHVWVHIEGENEKHYVERNYYLVYSMYTDGWILDSIECYTDINSGYYDITIPKCSASEDDLDHVFSYLLDSPSFSNKVESSGSILYQSENLDQSVCSCVYQVVFDYPERSVQEILTADIAFTYQELSATGTWGWECTYCYIERDACISPRIEGLYEIDYDSGFYNTLITLDIAYIDEETCEITNLYFSHNGANRSREFSANGIVNLYCDKDEEGNLSNIVLKWSEQQGSDCEITEFGLLAHGDAVLADAPYVRAGMYYLGKIY